MSSTSSFPKPQSRRTCEPSEPLATPSFWRLVDLLSMKGTMALLDLRRAAIGTETTSSEPFGRVPSGWLSLRISPCWPTLRLKIDGNGSGIGRGHGDTEGWENFGFVALPSRAEQMESFTWDMEALFPPVLSTES